MQKRDLGESELSASAVVLGTWAIGGDGWGGEDEKDSINAIHAALASGIDCIDTAPIYGEGRSEEVVGKALVGRRDSVILATKCGLRWDIEEGELSYEKPEGGKIFRNLKPDRIREEVERSLRRLKTDYIDLYQTHWQDATTPIADSMSGLLKLRDEGKIRAIGVSNVDPSQLAAYRAEGLIASAQEHYSMIERAHAETLFPACRDARISVLAYSPLAMGLLTGKITPERKFADSDMRAHSPRFSVENRQKIASLLARLRPYADAHGLTLAQLVINWTIEQTEIGITHVLCGARTVRQAEENAIGGEGRLSSAEISEINTIVEESAPELPPVFG